MLALAASLASLAFVSPAGTTAEVRWIVGPASVELASGRVRCTLPGGLALASGPGARAVLAAVSPGAERSALALVSPLAPAESWFVVLSWRSGAEPRRARWTARGRDGASGVVVNENVELKAGALHLRVTLVSPLDELPMARPNLDRVVEGIGLTASPDAHVRAAR
jgi:hypothetical protein